MSTLSFPFETTWRKSVSRPSKMYRPELDALRFFAFLGVFITHSVRFGSEGMLDGHPFLLNVAVGIESMGRFGLSLFFLLSSFLITSLLLAEQEKTGAVHLGSFYLRRILRIWPLYFSFLLATYIVGRFWAPAAFSSSGLFAFCLLSGNWYIVAGETVPLSLTILWSISVEEQFYLVWPSIVRHMTRARMRQFCVGVAGVSLLCTYLLARSGQTVLQVWCNTLSEMGLFAVGALLAIHLGLKDHRKSGARAAIGILGGLACWTVAHCIGFAPIHPPPAVWPAVYGLVAAGCASFLWAFLHLPRLLIHPALVYLGRISYGLYVFHALYLELGEHLLRDNGPHLRYLWLPIVLAVTVGTAALSYEFFEKPFLRIKHRFEFVHSRTA
jgi:peptidoglycan/LPS O-acetylase OafA/YrhL